MGSWTLETIAWDRFDASKVDSEILRNIKAAALVERNGADYGIYLARVFGDDPSFMESVSSWVSEEIQHGMALGRWAQLADPGWDFDAAFARFRAGFKLPLEASGSVRGSQAGEMMARCIVETGTSSYYSALKDASDEPVLKQVCAKIAADEFRHYKLFYAHLRRCLQRDRLSRLARLRIGWGGSPRARTTSLPTPISPPTSRSMRSMTESAACGPMHGAPTRSIARAMSSAPWRWC